MSEQEQKQQQQQQQRAQQSKQLSVTSNTALERHQPQPTHLSYELNPDYLFVQNDWSGPEFMNSDEFHEFLSQQFESSSSLSPLGRPRMTLPPQPIPHLTVSQFNPSSPLSDSANNSSSSSGEEDTKTNPGEDNSFPFPSYSDQPIASDLPNSRQKHSSTKRKASVLDEDSSSSSSSFSPAHHLKLCRKSRKIDTADMAKRRERYNATERKRREKINEKIDELRKLLPAGGEGVKKVVVLHQTAERIRNLQSLFNNLLNEKRRLEHSRNEILQDFSRLKLAFAQYQSQVNASTFVHLPAAASSSSSTSSPPSSPAVLPIQQSQTSVSPPSSPPPAQSFSFGGLPNQNPPFQQSASYPALIPQSQPLLGTHQLQQFPQYQHYQPTNLQPSANFSIPLSMLCNPVWTGMVA